MHRTVSTLLVIFAVVTAFALAMDTGLRLQTFCSERIAYCLGLYDNPVVSRLTVSEEESCYPFAWQARHRERLRALLATPDKPPAGTDALALAQYAECAITSPLYGPKYEQLVREGMRRDPDNALYHYLLARAQLKRALTGKWPTTGDDGRLIYHYTVADRQLLDQAMQEVATGMDLPLYCRYSVLWGARLDAMPAPQSFEWQMHRTAQAVDIVFLQYPRLRDLAQVNGFYLSLLFDEGRRRDAEPFLRTGERFAVQLAGDDQPNLTSLAIALGVHNIARTNDAAICKEYGLDREAVEIERRFEIVSGELQRQKQRMSGVNTDNNSIHQMLLRHGGAIARIVLPQYNSMPIAYTVESLRPSRLVEYYFVERSLAAFLPLLFIGLLLYSALKYWRWRLALAGQPVSPHDVRLSGADWARILLIGVALPLGLYWLYTANPTLSGRDTGLYYMLFRFTAGILPALLWLLIVPTSLAAGAIWRRSLKMGSIDVMRPRVAVLFRGTAAVMALLWSLVVAVPLLLLLAWALLSPIAITPMRGIAAGIGAGGSALLMLLFLVLLLLPLLPALWERRHTDCAQHFLALARTMIPVYAVLALCTAVLWPALLAAERRCLQEDTLIATGRTGDMVSFTQAETRLVLDLRETVLQGAKTLIQESEGQKAR